MPGFGAIGEFAIGQLPGVVAVEVITVDKWYRPLSEPSVKTKPGLTAAAQMAFAAPAIPTVPFGWFEALSEPAVKTRPGLRPSQQMALTTSPLPFVSFGWFRPLSEPVVKVKPSLKPSQQMAHTGSLQPFVSFAWFKPLSEPVRLPIGLKASQQQFLAQPPRLLPTPTVTGSMNLLEQGDTALLGVVTFSTPVEARIGIIELPLVPFVGLVEMAASAGASGVIEDTSAPASGSPVVVIGSAAVGIRII